MGYHWPHTRSFDVQRWYVRRLLIRNSVVLVIIGARDVASSQTLGQPDQCHTTLTLTLTLSLSLSLTVIIALYAP